MVATKAMKLMEGEMAEENTGHVTKDYKYNRMARELKEKDDAARGSEAPKHVFHSVAHDVATQQLFNHPYIPTNTNVLQQPSNLQGYFQSPYC